MEDIDVCRSSNTHNNMICLYVRYLNKTERRWLNIYTCV